MPRLALDTSHVILATAVAVFWLPHLISGQGCTPPDVITGGYYAPVQALYAKEDIITYHCDTGYHMASGTVSRQCSGITVINSYFWTGNEPSCALKTCGEPVIPNADFDIPDSTSYQSSFYYTCNENYSPMGFQLATCLLNNTWSYTPCEEPEFFCSEPPLVQHGQHNTSQIRQQHGITVKYSCDVGYELDGEQTITCDKNTWYGTPPICKAYAGVSGGAENKANEAEESDPITDKVLPIVAGVMTALVLTAILIVTVLCLRYRQRKSSSKRSESADSESSTSPAVVPTPRQSHLTPQGSIRLPVHPNGTVGRDAGLMYHRIQCQHAPQGSVDYGKGDYGMLPCGDSPCHFRPVILSHQSDHMHSSSPSTVQSDVPSVSESEFHTIRECLGDFKNNNNPSTSSSGGVPPPVGGMGPPAVSPPAPPVVIGQQVQSSGVPLTLLTHPPLVSPPPNYHQIHHPHNVAAHPHNMAAHPHPNGPHQQIRTRTLWTPDGRPYEAVTCAHGVEHVYQPLEHIYEEPRMWTHAIPSHPHAV